MDNCPAVRRRSCGLRLANGDVLCQSANSPSLVQPSWPARGHILHSAGSILVPYICQQHTENRHCHFSQCKHFAHHMELYQGEERQAEKGEVDEIESEFRILKTLYQRAL